MNKKSLQIKSCIKKDVPISSLNNEDEISKIFIFSKKDFTKEDKLTLEIQQELDKLIDFIKQKNASQEYCTIVFNFKEKKVGTNTKKIIKHHDDTVKIYLQNKDVDFSQNNFIFVANAFCTISGAIAPSYTSFIKDEFWTLNDKIFKE